MVCGGPNNNYQTKGGAIDHIRDGALRNIEYFNLYKKLQRASFWDTRILFI